MSSRLIKNLTSNIPETNSTYAFQHFSGIYRNGKVLCHGSNNLRNSYNGECICYSTHAEMDVLYKLLRKYKSRPFKDTLDLSDCTIVVLRLSRDGSIKNSRPCNQCLDTMVRYRIKKILYSTDTGTFTSEKPESMEKNHVSSGWSAYNNPLRLVSKKV
jgi:deoxycytidylate deaminase